MGASIHCQLRPSCTDVLLFLGLTCACSSTVLRTILKNDECFLCLTTSAQVNSGQYALWMGLIPATITGLGKAEKISAF